jgi:hypothetical protein
MDKENNHFKDQEGNTLIFVSKENKFHYNEISEAIEAVQGTNTVTTRTKHNHKSIQRNLQALRNKKRRNSNRGQEPKQKAFNTR